MDMPDPTRDELARRLDRIADELDRIRDLLGGRHQEEERERQRRRREQAEHEERVHRFWRLSATERADVLFEVLGERRLTIRELTAEIGAMRDWYVYESTVRSILRRLLDRSEIAREAELTRPRTGKGKVRYRYFKPAALDGEIADLERRLSD